jgi:hypothetical protein
MVLLVPNCPVCHQSVSLAARTLESSGIATAVMGCSKDIVEHVGVPRLLFSDFPLGNAAGRPRDVASQALPLELALQLLERAPAPSTTVQSPLRWSDSADWKLDYCNVQRLSADELQRRRSAFDAGKAQAKRLRDDAALARSGAEMALDERSCSARRLEIDVTARLASEPGLQQRRPGVDSARRHRGAAVLAGPRGGACGRRRGALRWPSVHHSDAGVGERRRIDAAAPVRQRRARPERHVIQQLMRAATHV